MMRERSGKLRAKFLSQITKEKLGGSLKESLITSGLISLKTGHDISLCALQNHK